jgi:flagellin FlaB
MGSQLRCILTIISWLNKKVKSAFLKRYRFIKNNKAAGIGALIVFIAMVLVAGIAASVLIQTSNLLESQAYTTGRETTKEVATGLVVYDVIGYTSDSTGGDLEKMIIMVKPRAGSSGIDLQQTYVELSNKTRKVVLNYTTSKYSNPTGQDDIFQANVFPDDNYGFGSSLNTDGSQFGVLVVEDADNSFASATDIIMNGADKAYLCINLTGCFNNLTEREDVRGMVVPEFGAPGVISFTTPKNFYGKNVFDLQ